ncbi:unnamed protein product [Adineta steineri]|uniref:Uncharacterized protein n=1 Tax=Adineta steineri TaxID=433720 RepID=A0A819U1V4_9BILA|nr:unnamed protein product [Adineta steineri]CAF4087510.1 unnamed protein product [Adineta steineri]
MSQTSHSHATVNEEEVDDDALIAMIPFSGALSPDTARSLMAGPTLNGPSGAIWRRTSISHSNINGTFCLYACDRTEQGMWIPSGDFFVSDRSQETPVGSIMDYLIDQQGSDRRSTDYGFHQSSSMNRSTNVHIQRSQVRRSGPVRNRGCLSLSRPSNRPNLLAPPEPRPPGRGSRRSFARRERREQLPEVHNMPASSITNTNITSSNDVSQQ